MKANESTDEMKTELKAMDENSEGKKGKEEKRDGDEVQVVEEKEGVVKNGKAAKSARRGGTKKRKSTVIEGATTTIATNETDTTGTTATNHSGRDRKSVKIYDPPKYDKTDEGIRVTDGRGMALKSTPRSMKGMESAAASETMAFDGSIDNQKKEMKSIDQHYGDVIAVDEPFDSTALRQKLRINDGKVGHLWDERVQDTREMSTFHVVFFFKKLCSIRILLMILPSF